MALAAARGDELLTSSRRWLFAARHKSLITSAKDKDVPPMPRVIVVVPCYNEAKRLNLRTIQDYGRRPDAAELLFVNDGSRDETLELLEHLHGANPRRFSFLHLAQNGGKAEAVRQGILLALRSGADYVGFWDADLATPLADIDPFVRVLDSPPADRAGHRHADAAAGTPHRAASAALLAGPVVCQRGLAGPGHARV